MDRLLWSRLTLLTALFLLAVSTFIPTLSRSQLGAVFASKADDGLLTVAFLDVGQGDAIYIETPDGVQMLIDGGPDNTVLRELGQQMSFWDRSIDTVLATHPDKDHIGGLVDVLTRYEVSNIIRTENDSDTAVSSAFVFASTEETALVHIARAGNVITIGASTTLTIYSPASDPSQWESNTSSIVAKFSYGEIDFMLTGDAPVGIEEYLVEAYGTGLESEVLKLGHHGSKTSTADSFLLNVTPQYAVVSAEKASRYGHPHEEVVKRVTELGIKMLSTAEQGTIIFKSDGNKVWVE